MAGLGHLSIFLSLLICHYTRVLRFARSPVAQLTVLATSNATLSVIIYAGEAIFYRSGFIESNDLSSFFFPISHGCYVSVISFISKFKTS